MGTPIRTGRKELVSDIQALDQELNQEINAHEKELKQTPA